MVWIGTLNQKFFLQIVRGFEFTAIVLQRSGKFIEKRSVFFEVKEHNVEPDGLYVDRYGNIWSCLWNAGTILQINQMAR